ncbi:MAG: cbb3-type cytochrome c oxidase subunit 3 [Hyphomicrobium sp.]|nr:cbb3-type cytochrome c oxidase subunit 3 [Hyphomicrobium sp.]
MSYETVLGICQLVAMAIFGTVMAGIVVHVLRPKNKAHFEAVARLALNNDDTMEEPHGR